MSHETIIPDPQPHLAGLNKLTDFIFYKSGRVELDNIQFIYHWKQLEKYLQCQILSLEAAADPNDSPEAQYAIQLCAGPPLRLDRATQIHTSRLIQWNAIVSIPATLSAITKLVGGSDETHLGLWLDSDDLRRSLRACEHPELFSATTTSAVDDVHDEQQQEQWECRPEVAIMVVEELAVFLRDREMHYFGNITPAHPQVEFLRTLGPERVRGHFGGGRGGEYVASMFPREKYFFDALLLFKIFQYLRARDVGMAQRGGGDDEEREKGKGKREQGMEQVEEEEGRDLLGLPDVARVEEEVGEKGGKNEDEDEDEDEQGSDDDGSTLKQVPATVITITEEDTLTVYTPATSVTGPVTEAGVAEKEGE
ncbi:hypothetical protein F4778DRAFT_779708 [Xylariomycetidae sp. FL2044]|nr:hypothetical protein F4778DRAFT_779708 [Xylariomycetidae sp. FL2044]